MDDVFERFLAKMEMSPGISEARIGAVEARLGTKFPADYKEFLLRSDGASGFVGSSYLLIWPVEDIEKINQIASVDEFAPGLILFGSDGGGMSYAFDQRNHSGAIVEVPSIGMSLKETVFLATTFRDFLEHLSKE